MSAVTLVLATSTGGVGAHVASLVRGLGSDGWQVNVCGPQATDDLFGFSREGALFTAISGKPGDPEPCAWCVAWPSDRTSCTRTACERRPSRG